MKIQKPFLGRRGQIFLFIIATLLAAYFGWRQYNLNWIRERHEAMKWVRPDGIGEVGLEAVTGIGKLGPENLPWSLRYWGEHEALSFIYIELKDLPEEDHPRAYRLKALFPEADVQLRTPLIVGDPQPVPIISALDIPTQEQNEAMAQFERISDAVQEGRISQARVTAIMQKVMQSPAMPSLVVGVIDQHLLQPSGLTDEEKSQCRQVLNRFVRGVMAKRISDQEYDEVMIHVAIRQPNGQWQLIKPVSDEELRAALNEAKTQVEAAGDTIPFLL